MFLKHHVKFHSLLVLATLSKSPHDNSQQETFFPHPKEPPLDFVIGRQSNLDQKQGERAEQKVRKK